MVDLVDDHIVELVRRQTVQNRWPRQLLDHCHDDVARQVVALARAPRNLQVLALEQRHLP